MNMLLVFLDRIGKDGYVILINCTEFANIFSENVVHVSLKGCGSVAKSLGHDNPFIKPKWSLDCCLVYIIRMHANLIICTYQINFSTNDASNQYFQDFVLSRGWCMFL